MISIPLSWPTATAFLMPSISAILLLTPKRSGVGEENFEWVVETAANYAIERAADQSYGTDNLPGEIL